MNNFTCGDEFNRAGTLCGKCMDGYYPLVYSYDMNCIPCPNGASNWWKFVLRAFFPLTIFYFAILFFKVNVTSSYLQGFVFYCQAFSAPQITRVLVLSMSTKSMPNIQNISRYIGSFYGFWNLDFFRLVNIPICLGTDMLQTLMLDLVVGVYPLFLLGLSYLLITLHDRNFKPLVVICRPVHVVLEIIGRNWEIRTSIIDSFATFILLTNVKFLSVAFDLLAPVTVYQLNSTGTTGNYTTSTRLFYDATLEYFGPEHRPYGIIGTFVLLAFVVLPTLVLLLYPFRWFQKLLNLFPVRWYILHTFVDSFQGCYKDGTEPGTRDCRWFASMFFLVHLTAMSTGVFSQNVNVLLIACVLLSMAAILLVVVQPFKRDVSHYTYINTTFMLLLALWYVCVVGLSQAKPKSPTLIKPLLCCAFISGTLPLVYITVLILQWMCRHRRFGSQLLETLKAQRHGYELLH